MVVINRLLFYRRFDYFWQDRVLFGYQGDCLNEMPLKSEYFNKFSCIPITVETYE